MEDLEDFKSHSNAIKIKYDLQRMVTAKWAMIVKTEPYSIEAESMQTLLDLIKVEKAEKLTRLAYTIFFSRTIKP
jgi:hypothetical protein